MKVCIVGLALLALTLTMASAQAGIVAYIGDPGTTNVTTALSTYQTTGYSMDGMTVRAFFADGTSDSATWTGIDQSSGSGGALGTNGGWSLYETGDTFDALWTLHNGRSSDMIRLLIDAGAGNTVFDVNYDIRLPVYFNRFPDGNKGTPGSENGRLFEVPLNANQNGWPTGREPYDIDHPLEPPLDPLDVTATYHDLVALSGQEPVGDLYRRLELQFTSTGLPGLRSGESLSYYTDTDSILQPGDITPVPEPTTLIVWSLLGASGAAVGWWRRRRAA
jgi:hypothetical protein